MKEAIRLLPLAAGSSAWNMAVDEALLEAGCCDRPTLRFYEWTEQAVSVGNAQRVRADLYLDRIQQRGITLVRRASGGAAIYHQYQLGISLTVANKHRLNSSDISQSYRPFGQVLSDASIQLGVDARPIPLRAAREMQLQVPISRCCLAGANPFEPFAGGRKVAGLAQIRRRGRSLIHAVIPLHFDPMSWAALLISDPWTEDQLVDALSAKVAGLNVMSGRYIAADEFCDAVRLAFEVAGFRLEAGELTYEEIQFAQQLYEERYSQRSWTYRL